MAEAARKETLFCCLCFASADDGSWGGSVLPDYCTNCGAGGSAICIPEFAVESIRKSASWVGRRYYPQDEDLKMREELRALRALVGPDPRDKAELLADYPLAGEHYRVTRRDPAGTCTSVTVQAADEDEAMEKANLLLRYQEREA